MFKSLAIGAALALVSTGVLAQEPPKGPSLDQQVEQSQMRLYAAQADHYLALAKKFQAQAIEGAQREAAKDAWWASWWKGTYPETPAPSATAAPQKPPAK